MSMENQKILDVVALAAQLQAVACEESGIISVSYDKCSPLLSFRPGVYVHVISPEMVDAVSKNARLCPIAGIGLKYCAKNQNVEVFAILTLEKAVDYTGKSRVEIAQMLEAY